MTSEGLDTPRMAEDISVHLGRSSEFKKLRSSALAEVWGAPSVTGLWLGWEVGSGPQGLGLLCRPGLTPESHLREGGAEPSVCGSPLLASQAEKMHIFR